MIALICFVLATMASPFKSTLRLIHQPQYSRAQLMKR
jgi:hypothetical protein